MAVEEPLWIELNFDTEREQLSPGDASLTLGALSASASSPATQIEQLGVDREERDARHVQVKIKGGKVLQEQDAVALQSAPEEGDSPCPVRIRPGTVQFPKEDTAEFRAELDIANLIERWGSVEAAARHEHPVLIRVKAEETRKRRGKSHIEDKERRGTVSINLNTIRWKWTPLVRDDKGNPMDEGPAQENTPIEVKVDGTRQHGFRLELERVAWDDQRRDYKRGESDFVHYLSPDHKLKDMSVVELVPRPWDIKAKPKDKKQPLVNQQQIVTYWWTQDIPADHEIFKQLPVETTIRVRAYPARSIREHVSGARPITNPPNAAVLATREIPLRLVTAQWEAHLVSPDPEEPPFLLEDKRPWEDCINAEFEVFSGSNPNARRYMKDQDVEWEMVPEEDNTFCGTVRGSDPQNPGKGTWRVDGNGRVKFRFCPKRDNALLLEKQNAPGRYFANFKLRLKGPSDDKKGPPITAPGKDEKEPTFVLDWAPKFDLAVFKSPFFLKTNGPLDLDKIPKDGKLPRKEEAEPLELSLTPDEKLSYRKVFRYGGTLKIRPAVPWDSGDGNKTEFPLRYYSLLVGEGARNTGEDPRIIPMTEPTAEGAWPDTVTIPPRPGLAPDQATKQEHPSVQLKPEVALHPDVKKYFDRIAEESRKVEGVMAASEALPAASVFFGNDPNTDFKRLGAEFGETATRFFAETPQTDLLDKGKPLVYTLSGMPMFVRSTGDTWKRLGTAINLHRETYKKMEGNLLTFYYDFLCWRGLEELVNGILKSIRQSRFFGWLPEKIQVPQLNWLIRKGSDALHTSMLKTLLEAHFLSPVKEFRKGVIEKIRAASSALRRADAERNVAAEALAGFRRTVARFGTQTNEILELTSEIEQRLARATASGASGEQLREMLRPLVAQRQTLRNNLRESGRELAEQLRQGRSPAFGQRVMRECQYRTAEASEQALKAVGDHLKTTEQTVELFLQGKTIDAKEAKKLVVDFQKTEVAHTNFIPPLRQGAHQIIDEALDQHVEDCNRLAGSLRALKQTPGALADTNIPAPPALVGAGVPDLSGMMDTLDRHAASVPEAARKIVEQAKPLLDHRFDGAVRVVEAEKAALDGIISSGTKKGQVVAIDKFRKFLDETPSPPSTIPSAPVFGPAAGLFERIKAWSLWFIQILGGMIGMTLSYYWETWSEAIRYLILLPLNLILLIHYRAGIKLCEIAIHFFHKLAGPRGYYQATALTAPALQAATAAVEACGERTGDLFNYPYQREVTILDNMKKAAENWVVSDAPLDISIERVFTEGTKSGYEDYYPGQLKRSRQLLFRLCRGVLDKATLQNPPCDEDPGHRSVVVLNAGDSLEDLLKEFLASAQRPAVLEKKGGFWAPFWKLWDEAWNGAGWNLITWEQVADWVGFLVRWFCGILAVVAGIFAYYVKVPAVKAPLYAASAALLAAAKAASAASSAVRVMISGCGVYPFTASYPRDAFALQAVYYAAVFRPANERFQADSAAKIVQGYPDASPSAQP